MKVVHISYQDGGGAGLCAYRIHKELQNKGIDSKMLVMYKRQNDDSVIVPYGISVFFIKLFHALLRRLNIYIFESDILIRQSKEKNSCYTSPIGPINIECHPLVKEADLIHIHWADAYFDQPSFFKHVNKPIVWTVHDEGFFYGIAHYNDDRNICDPREKKIRKIKVEMLDRKDNIHVVLLSKYFYDHFGNDTILINKDISIINNFVDCSRFIMYDQHESRNELKLRDDFIYLVFIAADITDRHKALNFLINAVEELGDKRLRIIAIGDNSKFVKNVNVLDVGKIYDSDKLSRYLSAADFFIMPSLQEAFSQAPIEAMACGTPVIVTPVSGVDECVTNENGVICKGYRVSDLKEGIQEALSHSYIRECVRRSVLKKFSPDKVVGEYIRLYSRLLK